MIIAESSKDVKPVKLFKMVTLTRKKSFLVFIYFTIVFVSKVCYQYSKN